MKVNTVPKLKIEDIEPLSNPEDVVSKIISYGGVKFAAFKVRSRHNLLRILCQSVLAEVLALDMTRGEEVYSTYYKCIGFEDGDWPIMQFIGPPWAKRITFMEEGLPREGSLYISEDYPSPLQPVIKNIVEFRGPPKFILLLDEAALMGRHDWYDWLEKEEWTLGILKSPRYEIVQSDGWAR